LPISLDNHNHSFLSQELSSSFLVGDKSTVASPAFASIAKTQNINKAILKL